MELTPSFDDFSRGFEAGENQVVYARLAADLDTPVSLMLKLTGAARDAFMLESVTGGEVRGRYSIIGMKPDLIWQCHGAVQPHQPAGPPGCRRLSMPRTDRRWIICAR